MKIKSVNIFYRHQFAKNSSLTFTIEITHNIFLFDNFLILIMICTHDKHRESNIRSHIKSVVCQWSILMLQNLV